MRSGGISSFRISLPLLLLSVLISFSTFFWNEGLVPIFTRQALYIYKTEVKKNQIRSIIGTKDIWIRGEGTFIRVDHFDAKKSVLEGVSIYLLNRDFSLRGLIETPQARWNGSHWETKGATEWLFLPDGQMKPKPRQSNSTLPLLETPEDFKLLARKSTEFSFFDLQKQIADLKGKGFEATEYEVDLQAKMALPWLSSLMVLLAIPFGLRRRPGGGIALSLGLAMLFNLGYWFLLGFTISLGHSGALPPWIAAWLPNLILALVALFFSTAEE